MPERIKMALIFSGITFAIFSVIGILCAREKKKSIEWGMTFLTAGILAICVFVYGMFDSSYSMESSSKKISRPTDRKVVSSTPRPTSITIDFSKFFQNTSTAEPTEPPRKGMIKPDYDEYQFYCECGFTYDFDSNFYVINTYSKKYHRPSCEYARQMQYENIMFWYGPKGNLGIKGYDKCKVCSP